jgi:hypothetical protein
VPSASGNANRLGEVHGVLEPVTGCWPSPVRASATLDSNHSRTSDYPSGQSTTAPNRDGAESRVQRRTWLGAAGAIVFSFLSREWSVSLGR